MIAMLLAELSRCLPDAFPARPIDNVPVGAVVQSSQRVRPGDVFVAIRGTHYDGHDFASEAARRGAVAIVGERPFHFDGAASVVVADSREAFARLCATQAGHPTRRLGLTAVTGTNGKTTTAYLLEHIFRTAAIPSGLIGSVEVRYGERTYRLSQPSAMTTPDADTLQNAFRSMAEAGVRECVIEASSHALDMHRMAGCELDTAIFTNLQHDHLDYHGSLGDYFAAKRRLFELLDRSAKPKTAAVINTDDRWGRVLLRERRGDRLSYGLDYGLDQGVDDGPGEAADVRGRLRPGRRGARMEIETPVGDFWVDFPLMGKCNAYNALAAMAAALLKGISLNVIREGLATAPSVPGRFQRIEGSGAFDVYVDFAHNPAGLKALLQGTRAFARNGADGVAGRGRILLVFGCKGNDSDAAKRRHMGSIASWWADEVIITSDNSYDEDPWAIARDILAGVRDGRTPADVILNRREAIATALARARPGDTLLVAGKGHERTQVGAEGAVAFDDAAVVREEMNRLEGGVTATHGSHKEPVTT